MKFWTFQKIKNSKFVSHSKKWSWTKNVKLILSEILWSYNYYENERKNNYILTALLKRFLIFYCTIYCWYLHAMHYNYMYIFTESSLMVLNLVKDLYFLNYNKFYSSFVNIIIRFVILVSFVLMVDIAACRQSRITEKS